jgi:hypothetical protein
MALRGGCADGRGRVYGGGKGHDVRMLCFLFPCSCLCSEHGGFIVVHCDREAAPEVWVLDHGVAESNARIFEVILVCDWAGASNVGVRVEEVGRTVGAEAVAVLLRRIESRGEVKASVFGRIWVFVDLGRQAVVVSPPKYRNYSGQEEVVVHVKSCLTGIVRR